jgi:serine/threonine protein phosphatase PrpC
MHDTYPQSHQHPTQRSLSLPAEVWGATDVGREREGNEDAVYPHSGSDTFPFKPGPTALSQKGHLFVVADGVGGAQGGREASHWAIRVAAERYYDSLGPDLPAELQASVEAANVSLYEYLQSVGKTGAGCTMVAAVVHGNELHVANVGDSRAYLIQNGQILQLTKDHTLTQQKIDRGIIGAHQAALDPDSSVLTRSMGAKSSVEVDLLSRPLRNGDTVLLCSDGLTDMVPDEKIAQLAARGSPKRATKRLIKAANKRGGYDNISVIVARIGKRPAAGGVVWMDVLRRFAGRQKAILVGLGALTVIVVGVLLGWTMYGVLNQPDPTLVPTSAPLEQPTTTTAPTVGAVTPDQPTDTVPLSAPTSTLRPTNTPTPTPSQHLPKTDTPTPVPAFVTPTNVPQPPVATDPPPVATDPPPAATDPSPEDEG